MNTKINPSSYDSFEEDLPQPRRKPRPTKPSKATLAFVQQQDDTRSSFQFTYKAARFEEWWLLDSLGEFYEHQWVSDVLRRVKGGKEASVYLCRAGSAIPAAQFAAAKVYRPRMLRNLKNDAAYREGRTDLDAEGRHVIKDADLHAMAKRTAYGEELRHTSWIAYEFNTLKKLHAAGADVPEPFAMQKNAILLEYIGDEFAPAPTLNEVSLEPDEVEPLFDRVLANIQILLRAGFIHGDLSAYNILYWEGNISLIDFPQVVSVTQNRNAYRIFGRDVARVCDYFTRQGLNLNPGKIASDLWQAQGLTPRPAVDVRLLDAENPQDRALWQGAEN